MLDLPRKITSIRAALEQGSGRSFIIVYESDSVHALHAEAVARELAKTTKVLLLESDPVAEDSWQMLTRDLITLLGQRAVRQASFIGFSGASALIQNVYLHQPKLVRTVVFIDSASRPHPTGFSRFVDWLERKFPLGLPLRSDSQGFDSRAHLQRIRCPALVITTPEAGEFLEQEARGANAAMPTAWYVKLSSQDTMAELCKTIVDFQDVDARCPQKNLKHA